MTSLSGGLQVVAFSDLVGSTSRAETLFRDEQEMFYKMFDAAFTGALKSSGVTHQVVKSTGDGFLFLFTNPEDLLLAYRACTAQVSNVSYKGEQYAVKMGAALGVPATVDGDPRGRVPNLAARLCGAASSNELLVDGALGAIIRDSPNLRTARLALEPAEHVLKGIGKIEAFRIRAL